MSNQLPPPEKLDLEGDSASVGLRWERWKRSLRIYLEASDIESKTKKRASMLLLGGTDLQEIFYNLPGASVEETEGVDVFETAIKKLDDYFLPKQNKTFERHIFRLIKQSENESFEKFIVRLRDQAAKCKFDKPEEHIIDQIIERCTSSELRKKILTMGDSVTLDKVITEANTLEVVNHQLESYEKKEKKFDQVNAITNNRFGKKSRWEETQKRVGDDKIPPKCGRCGRTMFKDHELNCPAKEKKCNACGKLGHFQRCCRTKSTQLKRKIDKKQED